MRLVWGSDVEGLCGGVGVLVYCEGSAAGAAFVMFVVERGVVD